MQRTEQCYHWMKGWFVNISLVNRVSCCLLQLFYRFNCMQSAHVLARDFILSSLITDEKSKYGVAYRNFIIIVRWKTGTQIKIQNIYCVSYSILHGILNLIKSQIKQLKRLNETKRTAASHCKKKMVVSAPFSSLIRKHNTA